MTTVAVDGLFKSFGDRPVLERISLTVESGGFCTLVGASGCGKTTFLRLLLGVEQPSRGTITVDGKPLKAEPGPDRGIVFQRYSVFPHLSVIRNVILGLEFLGARWTGHLVGRARRDALEKGEAALAAVGLGHVRDTMPSALSGGMQQRLAIAQALIVEPRILLLDEPFGALDPGIRNDMHGLMTGLWRQSGMTVFMVTHDLKEAFKLGTRVLTFDKVRLDPHEPDAFGATITYDLPGHARRETGTTI
ncbi:MAG: ATP-binding cassette domain-containing protein [Alphaproteobacteria bacterium]